MKAPDKIYVCIPTRLQRDNPKYVGIAWGDKANLTTPQIEEYIRKDTLLEWAKALKHIYELPLNNHPVGEPCLAKAKAFQIVIEKIESL